MCHHSGSSPDSSVPSHICHNPYEYQTFNIVTVPQMPMEGVSGATSLSVVCGKTLGGIQAANG